MNLQSKNPNLNLLGQIGSPNPLASVKDKQQILNAVAALQNDMNLVSEGGINALVITESELELGLNNPDPDQRINDGIYLISDIATTDGGLLLRVFSDVNGIQNIDTAGVGIFSNPDYQNNGTYNDASIFDLTGVHWSENPTVIWETIGVNGTVNYQPKVRFNITNTSADFVVNGGFAVDASGWTLPVNGLYDPIQPGVLFSLAATPGNMSQNAPISNGGTYTVAFTVYGFASGSITPMLGGVAGAPISANGAHTQTFAAGFAVANQLSFTIAPGTVLGITGITCIANIAVNDSGNTPGSTFKVLATDNITYMDVVITGGDCDPDATLLDDASGAVANITSQVATIFGVGDSIDDITTGATGIIETDTPTGTNGKSPGVLRINNINLLFSDGDELQDANGHIAYQRGAINYGFNVLEGDIVIVANTSGVGAPGIYHYQKITATVSSQSPYTDDINFMLLTSDGTIAGKKSLPYGYIEVADAVDISLNAIKVINRYSVSDSFGNIYNNKANNEVTNFPFGNSSVNNNNLLQDTGTTFGNFLGTFVGNNSIAGNFGIVPDKADIENQVVVTLSAYDDDTAAGNAGLTIGRLFQTTGGGAIATAGVVCIKQ